MQFDDPLCKLWWAVPTLLKNYPTIDFLHIQPKTTTFDHTPSQQQTTNNQQQTTNNQQPTTNNK